MVGKLEGVVVRVRFEAATRQLCLIMAGRTSEAMMDVSQSLSVSELLNKASRYRRDPGTDNPRQEHLGPVLTGTIWSATASTLIGCTP